jgi:hypothetical protein
MQMIWIRRWNEHAACVEDERLVGGTDRLARGVVEARLGLERRRQKAGLGHVSFLGPGVRTSGSSDDSGGPRSRTTRSADPVGRRAAGR